MRTRTAGPGDVGHCRDQGVALERAAQTVLGLEDLGGGGAEADASGEATGGQAEAVVAIGAALVGHQRDAAGAGARDADCSIDVDAGICRQRQRAAVAPADRIRNGHHAAEIALAAVDDNRARQAIDGDISGVAGLAQDQTAQPATGIERQAGCRDRACETAAAGLDRQRASAAEGRGDRSGARHPQRQRACTDAAGSHRSGRESAGIGHRQRAGAELRQGAAAAAERRSQRHVQTIGIDLIGLAGGGAKACRVIGRVEAGELQAATHKTDGASGTDRIGAAQAQGTGCQHGATGVGVVAGQLQDTVTGLVNLRAA